MFTSAPQSPPPSTGVIDALRRFALLAGLITLAVMVLAVLIGVATRPKPMAVARMTLADPRSTSLFVAGQGVQVELNRYLADRAAVAKSTAVLEAAGAKASVDVEALRSDCSVTPVTDTISLHLSCSLGTAAQAEAAVDAIAESYREVSAAEFTALADAAITTLDEDRARLVQDLAAATADNVGQALTQATASRFAEIETRRTNIRTTVALFGDGVAYYDPARTPEQAGLVVRTVQYAFMGFAAGMVLAILVVWYRADSRPVAAESDGILDALGMPELGNVGEPGGDESLFEPSVPHRLVLGNINAVMDRGILAFTEISPTPGYASTVVRLAVAAAASGQRVLLVDADVAEMPVSRSLGMGPGPGLAQVLNGEAMPEAVMSRVNLSRTGGSGALGLMRPGFATDDLASLLQARRAHAVLDLLRNHFDLVVVAAPPLLSSAVATAAARTADGTVLVTERGVPLATLGHARRQIEFAATRRLGFLLVENNRPARAAGGVLAPMRFAG